MMKFDAQKGKYVDDSDRSKPEPVPVKVPTVNPLDLPPKSVSEADDLYAEITVLRFRLQKSDKELEAADRMISQLRGQVEHFRLDATRCRDISNRLERDMEVLIGSRKRRSVGVTRYGSVKSVWVSRRVHLTSEEIFRRMEAENASIEHEDCETLERAYELFERESLPFTPILGLKPNKKGQPFPVGPGFWKAPRLLAEKL